ncbi:MAG: hypothetical protein JWQ54_4936 [Mucilaginibacter sp.]|nr:hypothetical protein [Mucilaginibacter sp.]
MLKSKNDIRLYSGNFRYANEIKLFYQTRHQANSAEVFM